MTLRYDLRVNQGETFRLSVPVLDDNGAPISLSGMAARGQIRRSTASTDVLYEWSVAAGNLTFDTNHVVLTIPAATSSAWLWRNAAWDLELTDLNGDVTRLTEGVVLVQPEITR